MSDGFAELEIALLPQGPGIYDLDFRFTRPDSDADARLLGSQRVTASINTEALNALMPNPLQYGRELSRQLFACPQAVIAFAKARAAAGNLALRLRLLFSHGATELNALGWEMICDPEDDFPLAIKENIYLSRVLISIDSRPVYLSARMGLSVLVVIAAPKDLSRLGLDSIDSVAEIERAKRDLDGVQISTLPGRATLNNLLTALRASESGFDILYLVCHGGFVKNFYWLVLENEQQLLERVSGETMIQALKGLEHPPRLVVLLACEGARLYSVSTDLTFAARLSEAGIPAVLAMQGDISMPTASVFMPVFFRELARDGQIDRAVAVARGAVRDRPDYWMPVLFTCLKSGMIWKNSQPESKSPKYQVTINHAKGVVIGDNNTVNQKFG